MTEPIITSRARIVFIFGFYQSAKDQLFPGEATLLSPFGDCGPRIGRIADLPALSDFNIQPALAEITASRLGGSRSQKVTMKPVGGLEMQS